MPKFDVITIGSAVKDITIYTDQAKVIATPQNLISQKMMAFEYGAKISATDFFQGFGGGASNSAVTFARLGFKTAVLTALGEDEAGGAILSSFKKEKINTSLVQTVTGAPTAISIIVATDKKEKEHVVFTNRGAGTHLNLAPTKIAPLDARWVYLTALAGKLHLSHLAAVFNLAHKKNIKIAWNPGALQLQAGKRYLAAWLKKTDILIVNKDEAIELVLSGIKLGKKNPNHLNRPVYLLNILHEWGPAVVVVTDGKKGAYAYNGKKIYRQKILNTKVVDTTGVGDAFGSAFTAGMVQTKGNVEKALRWGAINSAAVVVKVGAQNNIVTLKQLKDKL